MHRFRCSVGVGIAVALSVSVPGAVRAQDTSSGQPAACVSATGPDAGTGVPDTAARASRDSVHPALRLFAAVQADEVRFDKQPKICVTMRGDARLDSVRVVGRRNLTSPVVRGTTYRDVYVAVEILGHLDAECISARITGAAAAGPATGSCASVGVRDSTSGRRTGAPPP
jgi:hypothetical protein